MKKRIDFNSPYTCMVIVIMVYLIKVITKIWMGRSIHSLALISDGTHNLSDLFEASIVLYVIHLAKQSEDDEYPVGRSAIEPFAVAPSPPVVPTPVRRPGRAHLVPWIWFPSKRS